MPTNTDWSKFQRRSLTSYLRIQSEVGVGTVKTLEREITTLKAEMEQEDIDRVLTEMKNYE